MNNSKNHSKNNGHRALNWAGVEPWNEHVDGAALLQQLREVFRNYVVLPQWGPEMLALWTVHTYAFQLREVTTYVGVSSPEKRCGKTTLLGVLSKLVRRPLAAANISPPALFRVIEEAEPTLLIDEADTFLQGNDEMRGILNAGYSRETAYVVRVSNETHDPRLRSRRGNEAEPPCNLDNDNSRPTSLARFSCWCPKVMAAIGRLPDTLADRCIVLRMQRKTPQEQCARLKDLDANALRRKCVRFVLDREAEISAARPQVPKGLNDRAGDIWEPLLALADLARGEWPTLAREAASGLSGAILESNIIGLLLIYISVEFSKNKHPKIFSRDLVQSLNDYSHRPWAEGLKKQLIDEVWLANQLRPYGLRPRTTWIDGVSAKGYAQEDFKEIFRRYVTKADLDEVKGQSDETLVGAGQPPPSGQAAGCT